MSPQFIGLQCLGNSVPRASRGRRSGASDPIAVTVHPQIIEIHKLTVCVQGHDMLLFQHSQLANLWIHLDLATADDGGGDIFVKTNEQRQIGKRGALH